MKISIRCAAFAAAFPFLLLLSVPVWADPPGDGHGRLHFSHPLVAESPSPDTKLRLDGIHTNESGEGGHSQTARLEAEVAFAPWVSVEADLPFTWTDAEGASRKSHMDTVELAVKLASFRYAEQGLLLGGGLEVGLPTGDDDRGIGSDETWEIEPFLDFGWNRGGWQVVGFVHAGFLRNEATEEPSVELGWNLSVLRRVSPCLEMLLELDGEEAFGGHEDGESVVNVTPGVRVRPLRDRPLWIGAGVSLPVTADEAFDARGTLSLFWHFR